jgi:hypothetical protein
MDVQLRRLKILNDEMSCILLNFSSTSFELEANLSRNFILMGYEET